VGRKDEKDRRTKRTRRGMARRRSAEGKTRRRGAERKGEVAVDGIGGDLDKSKVGLGFWLKIWYHISSSKIIEDGYDRERNCKKAEESC
jgi:hypothetical protein